MAEIDIEHVMESQLSVVVQADLNRLFSEYTDKLKPILAMVESFTGEFPGPVLNEIRAVNDHVSRCFIFGATEADSLEEIKKGRGHLVRAILDCYKYLLIAYEDKVVEFYNNYRDVCIAIVDNGKFLPELSRLHNEAKKLAVNAKIAESKSFPDKELSYVNYEEAILAYVEVDAYIRANSEGLAIASQLAKDQTESQSKINHKYSILSAVYGAILGAIVTVIIEKWQNILNLFE